MTILKIITVLISIESGGRINAINVKENAVGVLQRLKAEKRISPLI